MSSDQLRNHREQVAVMVSVKDEIESKISQRTIALERWFSPDIFTQSMDHVERVEDLLDSCRSRLRVLSVMKDRIRRVRTRVDQKSKWTDACKELNLPTKSSIIRNLNFQFDATSQQLGKVSSELNGCRVRLLRQLSREMYPIEFHGKFRSIRGLILPSLSGLKRCELKDEESVSTALGYLAHRTDLVSRILDTPTKLVLVPAGSSSVVKDRFSDPSLQEFPLYLKTGEKQKYITALQMLQDTLFHFIQYRGKRVELSGDLLDLTDTLLSREISPNS